MKARGTTRTGRNRLRLPNALALLFLFLALGRGALWAAESDSPSEIFAPFAGGPILRNRPPDRYVINFRASYDEETQAIVDALIDIAGLKPSEIAFFTQKDNSAYSMGMTFLERHGLKDRQRLYMSATSATRSP
jgi:hypothetical protein